jgi:N-acetylmuramoyl-L-alanine amidase
MNKRFYSISYLSLVLLFYSCSINPYRSSNKLYKQQVKEYAKQLRALPADSVFADSLKRPSYWAGTVNFGLRKPNFVIIHHTAQASCKKTLETFARQPSQVSAHYLICKDGTLNHLLNDYLRAWHAGASRWGNLTDVNSISIGIELDNDGVEEFPEAQLNTLTGLLVWLKKAYNIPASNFIGHLDVAPGRKVDPGITFPWKRFAGAGFGLWYKDTTGLQLPQEFNPEFALRIIGYNTNPINAAIQSFRIHFLQNEGTGELAEGEKKVLYALMMAVE